MLAARAIHLDLGFKLVLQESHLCFGKDLGIALHAQKGEQKLQIVACGLQTAVDVGLGSFVKLCLLRFAIRHDSKLGYRLTAIGYKLLRQ